MLRVRSRHPQFRLRICVHQKCTNVCDVVYLLFLLLPEKCKLSGKRIYAWVFFGEGIDMQFSPTVVQLKCLTLYNISGS